MLLPDIYRLWRLLDLTSLNESDTEATMAALFAKAETALGHVAAVCIPPRFVGLAATQFAGTPVKVATVANFPTGAESLEAVLIGVGRAIQDGAHEMDVVFPYQRYLAGEREYARSFVRACKAACGEQVLLKIILETGALLDHAIIAEASYDALSAGADFIKTSTGKLTPGATIEAAEAMLLVIKQMSGQLQRSFGLKVSGGIQSLEQAAQYVALAEQIMGKDWVGPTTFRIGTSRLAEEMLKAIGG